MTFPDPVIEIAVEPKTKNDQEKDVPGSGSVWPPKTRPSSVETDLRSPVRRS